MLGILLYTDISGVLGMCIEAMFYLFHSLFSHLKSIGTLFYEQLFLLLNEAFTLAYLRCFLKHSVKQWFPVWSTRTTGGTPECTKNLLTLFFLLGGM